MTELLAVNVDNNDNKPEHINLKNQCALLLNQVKIHIDNKDYKSALKIVAVVICLDPNNPIAKEYYEVIKQELSKINPQKVEEFDTRLKQISANKDQSETLSGIIEETTNGLFDLLIDNSSSDTLGNIFNVIVDVGSGTIEMGTNVVTGIGEGVGAVFGALGDLLGALGDL